MNSENKPNITIIGPGRVGSSVAIAAKSAGYRIAAISGSRDAQKRGMLAEQVDADSVGNLAGAAAAGDIVLLAVSDGAIGVICEQIAAAGGFDHKPVVAHLSGALGSDILKPAADRGASVASAHPLQTFANPQAGAAALPGTYWFIEGESHAAAQLTSFAEDLAGHAVQISPEAKPLYHAAAVVTSNCLVALMDVAMQMYAAVGISPDDARRAIAPLAKASLENTLNVGPEAALTGPVARGDIATLGKHLDALQNQPATTTETYKTLGKATAELANRAGKIDNKTAETIIKILTAGEPRK